MRQEILDHMIASNKKWHELEQAGYHSGGWDEKTNQVAIFQGSYPHAVLVGYMDHTTLEISRLTPPEAVLPHSNERRNHHDL